MKVRRKILAAISAVLVLSGLALSEAANRRPLPERRSLAEGPKGIKKIRKMGKMRKMSKMKKMRKMRKMLPRKHRRRERLG